MKKQAKNIPASLKRSVMYQIFLRSFTPEGTLASAEKMLPHLAKLDVDILYFCPLTLADDDPRVEFWSDRQKASKMNNPKSPYRLKDYYKTDPEYGTDEDLKHFVKTAHELGMRVILDLVYYHCGPTASVIDENPAFVKRDENNRVKNGFWHFPELNFDTPELREYLWKNMEYFVREFDVDGYRCDAEDLVPLDFWEEGRRRIETIKNDVVMLAESARPECQEKAYDINYGWGAFNTARDEIFFENASTERMADGWKKDVEKYPANARLLRNTSNHDIANDQYCERSEKRLGSKGFEAMQLLCFTLDGIPFLYNGEEIADSARHSIFSDREHGKLGIDWSNAVTLTGQNRLDFICTLTGLRHTQEALSEGSVIWLKNPENNVIAFLRKTPEQELLVLINPFSKSISASVETESGRVGTPDAVLERDCVYRMDNGILRAELLPYGFAILEMR